MIDSLIYGHRYLVTEKRKEPVQYLSVMDKHIKDAQAKMTGLYYFCRYFIIFADFDTVLMDCH